MTEVVAPKRPGDDINLDAKKVHEEPAKETYRNYKDSAHQARVSNFYEDNHKTQTLSVNKQIRESWADAPVLPMTILEAVELLDTYVDQSDPDTDSAQIVHAFQTAEVARKAFPEEKWIHVVGLIHDAGKVLGLEKYGGFPQSFVVGDTFPCGAKYSNKIVFPEFFEANPDSKVAELQTENGIYEPGCGLSKLIMSFGHDEYLYQVLADSGTTLPEEAMYIVRFHSFYSHHQFTGYKHLMNEFDEKMLPILRRFQPCDLYSKVPDMPPISELHDYYAGLLKEFGLDKPLLFRKLTLPAEVVRA